MVPLIQTLLRRKAVCSCRVLLPWSEYFGKHPLVLPVSDLHRAIVRIRELTGGVWTLCLLLRNRNRSLSLLIMLTEAAARWGTLVIFFFWDLGLSKVYTVKPVEYWLLTWRRHRGYWLQTIVDRVNCHKLTLCLSALGWRDMNRFTRATFSLVAQTFPQVCVSWTQSIQYRDSRKLDVSLFRMKSSRLGLKGWLLGCRRN